MDDPTITGTTAAANVLGRDALSQSLILGVFKS
jgi:hypothetical protein